MRSRISPLPVLLGAGVASILLSRYTPLSLSVSSLFVYSLTISLYIIYITFIYPFYLSPLRHIPTVPGNPLWGQVYDFINEECGVPARRYHEAHGPSMYIPFVHP